MKIEIAEPPMLAEIEKAFPNRPKSVIYAFGDTIYNPGGFPLPPAIIAHEAAHGARQMQVHRGAEGWWRDYLENPQFRYVEELVAHAAEYKALTAGIKDRNRLACLKYATVARLLAPFYEYGSAAPTTGVALRHLTKEIE